ncbi:MAG: N-methylproline demethylase, partial [Alphaproteobacteria bacterium]|nr:N-methylproline demethylase [Alphaproteobacteria bacterium]
QVRLLTRMQRRAELIGIVDWRVERCAALGVDMRFNVYAEAADVLAEQPDVVIIATGGLPDTDILDEGGELVASGWDILSGDVKPGGDVLLYDDNGAHPGLQAAEFIAEAGARLELVTPERFFAADVGGLNHVPYARCFKEYGVTITINTRLLSVRREGNKLAALLGSDYSDRTEERIVDQVVVEHGTLPLDELYFDLKPQSANLGEVDYQALIAVRPQEIATNPDGKFRLFRIGDAVASRNIHAAIYDALRLCVAI